MATGNKTQRLQASFLKAFVETGTVSAAAEACKINRWNHYEWMKSAEYREQFEQAEIKVCRLLEDEAFRRARDGVKDLVLYQGQPVIVDGQPLYEYKHSDTLLMFILKGLKPERYRDRATFEHTGPDGKPLLTLADVDRLLIEGAALAKAQE